MFLLAVTFAPLAQLAQESFANGWIEAGVLSGVLGWLLFIHLPGKDKYIKELLELAAKDREADREARHSTSEIFQAAFADVSTRYSETSRADREAFRAIFSEFKTELRASQAGVCRWDARKE